MAAVVDGAPLAGNDPHGADTDRVSMLWQKADPTILTTQLVDRTLGAFREVVNTRLTGMDQATKLVADDVARVASLVETQQQHLQQDVDRQVAGLREFLIGQIGNVADVAAEKFLAIDTRFAERDMRTDQAAQESRISLGAALAAAKEAVSEQNKANGNAIAKSEVATQKQIDALVLLMTTNFRSVEDRIGEVKARLDRGDGHGTGQQDTGRTLIAVAALVLTALSILAGVWLAHGG